MRKFGMIERNFLGNIPNILQSANCGLVTSRAGIPSPLRSCTSAPTKPPATCSPRSRPKFPTPCSSTCAWQASEDTEKSVTAHI